MDTESLRILVLARLEDRQLDMIEEAVPEAQVLRAPQSEDQLLKMLPEIEVDFGVVLSLELFPAATRLKWIQSYSAGVEGLLHPELVESPVVVTKISGANAVPVAEHCIGLMFALARCLPRWAEGQGQRCWLPRKHSQTRDISGSTLGIIGLGAIGSELARRTKALGMRVLATKRRIFLKPDYVDELIPREELPRLIAQADFLSINCPETPETRGMIGEEELRMMKPTAYLINTARGPIVRQEGLIRALKEGWIAGAALDVTTPEPLPAEAELWNLPNVIVTPHTAGASPTVDDAKVALFCENLLRYTQGQPLLNIVDKRLGY